MKSIAFEREIKSAVGDPSIKLGEIWIICWYICDLDVETLSNLPVSGFIIRLFPILTNPILSVLAILGLILLHKLPSQSISPEQTSNFLFWQLAYSEFYFSPVLWPEFDEVELLRAINKFSERDRRYGISNNLY